VKLLLDTCTFLWIISDSSELSEKARQLFITTDNVIYLSVVSSWEIMVKHSLGKLPLPDTPAEFISNGRRVHHIESLALVEKAIWHLDKLPALHRDPFDRILVCQAMAHNLILLTPDPLILQYPVKTYWS